MADQRFFDNTGALTLDRIAEIAGARVLRDSGQRTLTDLASLDAAGPDQLSYCESVKFKGALERTRAAAVLVAEPLASFVPVTCTTLVCAKPAVGFAKVAHAFYPNPGCLWPLAKPPVHSIAPSARVGEGAVIGPNVFIGEDVEIGRDCEIAPGAVIGRGVQIGHNAKIGPHVTISHALIGDRFTIHSGSSIGQDGYGYIAGPGGHFKIPQLGRVIIQDDVEIGSNAAIARGTLTDTVIGEGTKIDNLVQIGHNTRIGRRCIIVAQVGFSGSVTVEDGVVFGGQVGIADHLTIGKGAYIAGKAGVTHTLEGGRIYGGFPAKPVEQWRREVGVLSRLAKGKRNKDERDGGKD
ncbi:MAG: UDP-3-O-(3-hydroxymyristoyl)glucosamine N-acyltransferase [Alphaproteobacteria bacterium]|nr:UDP-3-O-(3-hydroxymyristoyl)glucosamine N-acyltransferase [Alphaproteobacteria bacterium]